MRYPLFLHGSISCDDLERAFSSIGVIVRTEASTGRLIADPVPKFIAKDEKQPENVVRMKRVGRK